MNGKIQPILISMEDILASGGVDVEKVIAVMEKALVDYKQGRNLLPDKISQIFDQTTQNRINCMPGTLLDEGVCGVKWVSVFPGNPKLYAVPNVSGVVILSELKTGFPIALMDGALITLLRTACMGTIGAKYLARPDSRVYGAIGSGEQAKMHFVTMKTLFPGLKVCRVASRSEAGERDYIDKLQKKFPDVTFEACGGDYRKASREADIIVTAVSCQEPLLKADAIKPGAFYCHVGGWEDEYEVPLKADKIVCDRWEAVKHRTQTISRLYQQGRLQDGDIYADIADIIDGTKPGRENDREFTYFNSVGLAFIDVAVAYYFYRTVCEKGLGQPWQIQSEPLMNYLDRL